MKPQDSDNEQIAGLIKSLNLAWRQKQFDRLDPLFAETVVLQDSEGRRLVDGKTACIQSYRDFMEIAQVLAYEEEEPDIILRPGFAVASYGWRIQYEMNGNNFDDKGRDWLALENQDGSWRVVWRLLVQAAPPPPGGGNDK
jgi:ketosteroid isomerase-like protein